MKQLVWKQVTEKQHNELFCNFIAQYETKESCMTASDPPIFTLSREGVPLLKKMGWGDKEQPFEFWCNLDYC